VNGGLGFIRGFVAVSALLLGAPHASSAEKWDCSSPFPDKYMVKSLHLFADEVKQMTCGKIEMVVHPSATLCTMSETERAIQSGQLPIGEIFLAEFSNENAMFGS